MAGGPPLQSCEKRLPRDHHGPARQPARSSGWGLCLETRGVNYRTELISLLPSLLCPPRKRLLSGCSGGRPQPAGPSRAVNCDSSWWERLLVNPELK